MTMHSSNLPTPDDLNHLDADLHSLAAGLDALGLADRAGAGAGIEDRIVMESLAALHGVQPVAAQMSELGAMDRAAASSDLEDGVFAESAPALREGVQLAGAPVLRHTGAADRAERQHVRVVRRAWWSNQYARLAAAVVLVSGAAIGVRISMTPATPKDASVSLAQRVNSEMELLFAAMENRPAATTAPDSSDTNANTESDDLTKWLIEGSAS